MALATTRTVVILAEDMDAGDGFVGRGRRTAYLVDDVWEKLPRDHGVPLLDKAAGSLEDVDIPGWETEASDAGKAPKRAPDGALRTTSLVCRWGADGVPVANGHRPRGP